MPDMNSEELEILTCSYGPDLERCSRLCMSVDRHVPGDIGHVLVVPRRDYRKFAVLRNARRRVFAAEDILPRRFFQLPLSDRLWVDSRGWPVRGWILQQLIKLSADRVTEAELIMFADSDLQFVCDLQLDKIYRDGELRLHRIPGAMNEGRHRRWHQRAGTLLGERVDYFGSDYIGQLITWRRSQLQGLQQHIAAVTGKPWHRAVSRSLDISEYILYGSYVEHVVGANDNGHYYDATDLCHCCWFGEEAAALACGQKQLSPGALALLIQSNLGLAADEEQAILSAATMRPLIKNTGV